MAIALGAPASSRPYRWLPAGRDTDEASRQDAGVTAGWKPALRARCCQAGMHCH